MHNTPAVHYRKDYQPPFFLADRVDLTFDLFEDHVDVAAKIAFRKQAYAPLDAPLILDGEGLSLREVRVDGSLLAEDAYKVTETHLTLPMVPDTFVLETLVTIHPNENTALEGLYRSGAMFCTQCEAEGFRKITYHLDRPDVMAVFSVRVTAEKKDFPVLLSNGNCVEKETIAGGRHTVLWEDPHPKPSYLFALVAGNLSCIRDTWTTADGRAVELLIYTEPENADKCDHAMVSLKKSMAWDEEVFGLSYDLSTYMIVATNDFNMGAMENKGLNIFNSKYVLAKPETATDADFVGIEGVIAHEYFHNWTGNRVTLANWFQLSLKEGLTVFRDQEFTADMQSRAVKRIQDVRNLRARQFPEDAGPMAHPIRPESYIEMNNFYTMTVYEKGAEVIRMIYTLLGKEGFRKGMDLYFARHDGSAVMCEDFVAAMEDASGVDLGQFRLWYSQAGTPVVTMEKKGLSEDGAMALVFTQKIPDTPGQTEKAPMVIPVRVAFFTQDGDQIETTYAGNTGKEHLVVLSEETTTAVFTGVVEDGVVSAFRGFSAPVKCETGLTETELAVLMTHDSDAFNRWESGRILMNRTLLDLVEAAEKGALFVVPTIVSDALSLLLHDNSADPALVAEIVSLPTETEMHHLLSDAGRLIDPDAVHAARTFLYDHLATLLEAGWRARYRAVSAEADYVFTPAAVAARKLKNIALGYLARLPEEGPLAEVERAYHGATNMTDRMAALSIAAHGTDKRAEAIVQGFSEQFGSDPLVMDKWFTVQAVSHREDTVLRVEALLRHPAFSMKNPNKVRSLVGAFASANPMHFHRADGSGYRFLADRVVELNGINPQVGARMAGLFNSWKRYTKDRQTLMRTELERILATPALSRDIYEIVSKALA